MAVEKTNTKVITRTNHIGANSAMNQSEFPTITCNFLKAWRKSHVQGAIGFVSRRLKNWGEILSQSLNSHLKTALLDLNYYCRKLRS